MLGLKRRAIYILSAFAILGAVAVVLSISTAESAELKLEDENDATLETTAENLYDLDQVAVYPVEASFWEKVFPNHPLYVVYGLEQHPAPTYTMALYQDDPEEARDATSDFNLIMDDAGVVIDGEASAKKHAKALAQAANADMLPVEERELLDAGDDARFDASISDPSAELQGSAWKVELSTWAPDNGFVVDWIVYVGLEEVHRVEADIASVGDGQASATWQTMLLGEEVRLTNRYDGTAHDLVVHDMSTGAQLRFLEDVSDDWVNETQAMTFDGSAWQAQRHADDSWDNGTVALAENLTEAGTWSHEWLVGEGLAACADGTNPDPFLAFDQPDPDCTFEVRVLPDDVVHSAASVDLTAAPDLVLHVHPDVRGWLASDLGWADQELPSSLTETSRTTVGGLHHAFLAAHDDPEKLPEIDPMKGYNETDERTSMEEIADHRVVIGFVDGLPDQDPAYLDDYEGQVAARSQALELLVYQLDNATDATDLIADAENDTDVDYAERDQVYEAQHAAMEPNDALWDADGQWGLRAINASQAWTTEMGGDVADIHILDSGVDLAHVDLMDNLPMECEAGHDAVLGRSFVEFLGAEAETGEALDTSDHGTNLAGIAGAVTDNTAHVAGTSEACMTPVRVTPAQFGLGTWIAMGIEWSTSNGAEVISLSLGSPNSGEPVTDAVQHARSNGVLLTAAAGNAGCDSDVFFPAAHPETVAVGALQDETTAASYSTCGPEIDLVAPGGHDTDPTQMILSTAPGQSANLGFGTSMAQPFVAGVAGLAISANPDLQVDEIECILQETADELGGAEQYGAGRVNAHAAVHAADGSQPVGCVSTSGTTSLDTYWMASGKTFEFKAGGLLDGHAISVVLEDDDANGTLAEDWIVDHDADGAIYQQAAFDKASRESVDAQGVYSYLWINASDVDAGEAKIGDRVYQLEGTTSSSYVFGDGNVSFTYDRDTGVLVDGSTSLVGTVVEQADAGTSSVPGTDPVTSEFVDFVDDTNLTPSDPTGDGDGDSVSTSSSATTVRVSCTVEVSGNMLGEDDTCEAEYAGTDQNLVPINDLRDIDWPEVSNGSIHLDWVDTNDDQTYFEYFCKPDTLVYQEASALQDGCSGDNPEKNDLVAGTHVMRVDASFSEDDEVCWRATTLFACEINVASELTGPFDCIPSDKGNCEVVS